MPTAKSTVRLRFHSVSLRRTDTLPLPTEKPTNVRFRFNVVCFTYATIGELVLNFWDLGKQTSRQHDSKLFSVRMRRSLKMNLNYHCCCYHLVQSALGVQIGGVSWQQQFEDEGPLQTRTQPTSERKGLCSTWLQVVDGKNPLKST